jgi:hypothetical protein
MLELDQLCRKGGVKVAIDTALVGRKNPDQKGLCRKGGAGGSGGGVIKSKTKTGVKKGK